MNVFIIIFLLGHPLCDKSHSQNSLRVDFIILSTNEEGFPGGSAGKESACSAGDPGSIPGSGRFPGEGRDYPLQYSWAPLVAQVVKNPPAMQETLV